MAPHGVALAGRATAEMPTHSEGLEIVAGVDVHLSARFSMSLKG
jgi:hypothetical protein